MPVSDALFPKLPAEQDYFSAYAAGEIEQTNIEVLDLHACGVDLGNGILHPLNRFFAFSFAASQLDDVEQGAAIQKNAVRCVLELSVYFFDQLLTGNGAAQQRFEHRQKVLRLIQGKGSVGHMGCAAIVNDQPDSRGKPKVTAFRGYQLGLASYRCATYQRLTISGRSSLFPTSDPRPRVPSASHRPSP